MLKYVIAIGVVAGAAIPALAAKEYFVVRGPDEKCKVVETRPTEKTIVVVGDARPSRRPRRLRRPSPPSPRAKAAAWCQVQPMAHDST
jgi:hypothetical protein